jgi:hypothetical protein
MRSKSFNLGLFGKKYVDTTFCLDFFKKGETNFCKKTTHSLGGIYNISKEFLPSIDLYYFEDDPVKSFIISELKEAKRSSILVPEKTGNTPIIDYKSIDWLHIAYIDDLNHSEVIDSNRVNLSVDFCTEKPRENYLHLIKNSKLVFDSRERKKLYSNILVSTPIILHDENGCECIINGEKTFSQKIISIKNLNVNGAGDIFAGIFINKYYNSSLSEALNYTCTSTANYLKKKNEI